MESKTAIIIGAVSALIISIVLYLLIMPKSKDGKLGNRFAQALHNFFNFKYMTIEVIAKFFNVFATFFFIVYGFFIMFCKEYGDYGDYLVWKGIKTMVFGPIQVRFIYEVVMLLVTRVKKLDAIEAKLNDKAPDNIFDIKAETILPPAPIRATAVIVGYDPKTGAPIYAAAPVAPVAPQVPVAPGASAANAPVIIGYDVNTGAPIYGNQNNQ